MTTNREKFSANGSYSSSYTQSMVFSQMASLFRRLFASKKKKNTRKDSITGRNRTFPAPYLSRLEGNQLQPGQSLIVRGFVTGNGDEFLIELTSGPKVEKEEESDQLDNRLLTIRADIPKRKVYFNACLNGEWGKEASVRHTWKKGSEFDIRIRCCEESFLIYIDHKLVAKFAYYVPMSNISHIYVNGDIELYTVSWEGKYYQVPYSAEIPGNFFPGRKLFLSGIVVKPFKQFTVDFQAGKDVAFRLNPRIKEKKFVRNSAEGEKWGNPETTLEVPFPFKKKKAFDLLVFCQDSRFSVFVDDVFVCSFDHRLPVSTIDRLTVEGDLEILGVHIK